MKLSVFTVSTPEYTPEETVKLLKAKGYDGVEWRIADLPPKEKPKHYAYENRYWTYNRSTLSPEQIDREAEAIKHTCDHYDLEISSLSTYLLPGESEKIEKVLQAATRMGCRKIRVLAPNYDGSERYNELFDRTRRQLAALEPLAKQYDVKINIEQHMNTIIPSASASYRLLSGLDPKYIGIVFDPGNMVFEGFENYQMTVEILGEYLGHFHVKNAVWLNTQENPNGGTDWKAVWSPLEKGIADIRAAVMQVVLSGYDDTISLEDFSNEVDTESKLENCVVFVKQILSEIHAGGKN